MDGGLAGLVGCVDNTDLCPQSATHYWAAAVLQSAVGLIRNLNCFCTQSQPSPTSCPAVDIPAAGTASSGWFGLVALGLLSFALISPQCDIRTSSTDSAAAGQPDQYCCWQAACVLPPNSNKTLHCMYLWYISNCISSAGCRITSPPLC